MSAEETPYHQQGPDRIVQKDRGGYDEHSKTEELVNLPKRQQDVQGINVFKPLVP
jgi:hypothetical protein